jgi:hypothetical protein
VIFGKHKVLKKTIAVTLINAGLLSLPVLVESAEREKEAMSGAWTSYKSTYSDRRYHPAIEYFLVNDSSNQNTKLAITFKGPMDCDPRISGMTIKNVTTGPGDGVDRNHFGATKLIVDGRELATFTLTKSRHFGERQYFRGDNYENTLHFEFTPGTAEDRKAWFNAMKRGNEATLVIATGSLFGEIRPSFSLSGFTAQFNRAQEMCESEVNASNKASKIKL